MAMMQPWIQQTGARVNFTGTRDLTAVLTSRIQAGNPPDVAILPNPGLMQQFAKAGNLKPITFMNMNTLNQQYSKAWIDLGSYNNQLYAIFMKGANKSTVWYNPKTFTANGWQTPKTWDDMTALSNKIVSDKKTPATPWSIGGESGAASGWPATDWIAQIFLNEYGGQVYDQWVAHQIPWTDSRIKEAWQRFGTNVFTNGYVPGGAAAVLATNFQDASYLPFQNPPKAAMYYEGDFVEGFIKGQFPSLVPGQDFSFFNFPTINQQFGNGITGGADEAVIFKDNPTIESFMNYISTATAQDIWVKRGGFTSLNKLVPISDYPDVVAQQAAQQLANATLFRFGAGDSMPSAVQTTWWADVLKYLQDPNQLDALLQDIENQAKTAYGQ